MGISNVFALAGFPLGLSFSKTKIPEADEFLKVSVAVNSTGVPNCQLPGVTSSAEVWVITFFSESKSIIGKTPSNIQPAGTVPSTFSGLLTIELAESDETIGDSSEETGVGEGFVGASGVAIW